MSSGKKWANFVMFCPTPYSVLMFSTRKIERTQRSCSIHNYSLQWMDEVQQRQIAHSEEPGRNQYELPALLLGGCMDSTSVSQQHGTTASQESSSELCCLRFPLMPVMRAPTRLTSVTSLHLPRDQTGKAWPGIQVNKNRHSPQITPLA